MTFLPHSQRWRVLAIMVACLLLDARSFAWRIATADTEPGRQICFEWAMKDGENAKLADTRNNLGIPDRDQNRVQETRQEYEEVLKRYRELAP